MACRPAYHASRTRSIGGDAPASVTSMSHVNSLADICESYDNPVTHAHPAQHTQSGTMPRSSPRPDDSLAQPLSGPPDPIVGMHPAAAAAAGSDAAARSTLFDATGKPVHLPQALSVAQEVATAPLMSRQRRAAALRQDTLTSRASFEPMYARETDSNAGANLPFQEWRKNPWVQGMRESRTATDLEALEEEGRQSVGSRVSAPRGTTSFDVPRRLGDGELRQHSWQPQPKPLLREADPNSRAQSLEVPRAMPPPRCAAR